MSAQTQAECVRAAAAEDADVDRMAREQQDRPVQRACASAGLRRAARPRFSR